MSSLLTIVLSLLVAIQPSYQKMKSVFDWKVKDVAAVVTDSNLDITISYDILNDGVASKSAVVLQPVVKYGKQNVKLLPLSVYRMDKRGAYPVVRSDTKYASGNPSEKKVVSGTVGNTVIVKTSISVPKDVGSFELFVNVTERRSVDKVSLIEDRKIATFKAFPMPEFVPSLFVVEPSDISGERKVAVPLFCSYDKKGCMTITDPSSSNSYNEFRKVVNDIVMSKLTRVSAIGLYSYTGISGDNDANMKTTAQRAAASRDFLVKQNVFGKKKVIARGMGENWKPVHDFIRSSYWGGDLELRSFLLGKAANDEKEAFLRSSHPDLWNLLESRVFDSIDCLVAELTFTVKPFTDINEIRSSYQQMPVLLSSHDFYLLAKECKPWSLEFTDILVEAAVRFPDDEIASLNAASALMMLGRYNEAGTYIRGGDMSDYRKFLEAVWLMGTGRRDLSYEKITAISLPGYPTEYMETLSQIKKYMSWKCSSEPWKVELVY